MRKRLYSWHLTLGRGLGAVLIIWALSGAAMILEPLVCPRLESPAPRVAVPTLDPATLPRPPSEVVPAKPQPKQIVARSWNGRGWYEVTLADGSVQAYDARSGATVTSVLSPEEVRDFIPKAGTPELLTDYDDQYRKGPLPVYRVAIAGPSAWIIYVDARSGAVEKKTSEWSRAFRWAGLGIHTWNLQYLKKSWDGARRILLVALVALPILVMGALSYWLLWLRDQQARARGSKAPVPIASRKAS